MLRTSCSWGADKMDVLALVRVDECQPIASDDFLDVLWRTAKDELTLVLGCAGNVGYTQHGGKPQQPDENLSFHFALHLTPPSRALPLQNLSPELHIHPQRQAERDHSEHGEHEYSNRNRRGLASLRPLLFAFPTAPPCFFS